MKGWEIKMCCIKCILGSEPRCFDITVSKVSRPPFKATLAPLPLFPGDETGLEVSST